MRRIQFILVMAALAAVCALAQTTTAPPFSVRVQQGSNVQVFGDGGTLALPSEGIGLPVEGNIVVTYTTVPTAALSSPAASITQIFVTGSTDFSLVGVPDVTNGALTLTPSIASFGMRVRYLPTNSRAAAAKITINYLENSRTGTFSINLTGTAPEFAYTYALLPNGNTTMLSGGETIQFPETNLLETSAVQVILSNKGSGQGTVNSVTYTGSSRFALAQVPSLPAIVDPGKDVRFSVRFTPDDWDPVAGAVQVDASGRKLVFKVQGEGLGAYFEYEILTARGFAPMDPGEVIKLPDAVVNGEKTTATVRVWNTGNLDGRIAALNVSGTGFSLIESPFMPYTLQPESSFTFKVQFAATQPGKAAGRLRVGQDNFELEGNALGPNLTYGYSAAGGAVALTTGGTVVLPAAKVGENSTVRFTVKNEGTAPQDIFSISVTATGTTFSVSGLPSLPRRLAPDSSLELTLTFAPVTLGSVNGTLKIDTSSFTLTRRGQRPGGPAGLLVPGRQRHGGARAAARRRAHARARPIRWRFRGTLNLNFTSDVFANDPAVQFSSGGRSIPFTVPAGSKQALFANNATQVRLQTGTVAGTISLTPGFATQAGGIDLTPLNPPALVLTVAQSAPRLLSATLSAKTAGGFTLLVTGYATGRAITQMDFQFTGVGSESFASTKVSIPVETNFNAWYQGTSSAQFGSQFTATVPFTLSGEIKDTEKITNLVDAIQSVSVTLTNRQGVSTARSVDLK